MGNLRSPAIAAAVAAVLAGTTGFCTFNLPPEPQPPETREVLPPVRLLPEAVIPFPLIDPK